jgi:hypothetical protein
MHIYACANNTQNEEPHVSQGRKLLNWIEWKNKQDHPQNLPVPEAKKKKYLKSHPKASGVVLQSSESAAAAAAAASLASGPCTGVQHTQ